MLIIILFILFVFKLFFNLEHITLKQQKENEKLLSRMKICMTAKALTIKQLTCAYPFYENTKNMNKRNRSIYINKMRERFLLLYSKFKYTLSGLPVEWFWFIVAGMRFRKGY